MAAKNASKKSQNSTTPLDQLRQTLLRPEIMGIVLILVSVFTLLSLVTQSNGVITGAWIEALQKMVGIGAWGVPFVTGALGIWMVIYAIERMPDLPWQRPAGFGLLFAAFVIGASLALPAELRPQLSAQGEGGGVIGWAFADILESFIGAIGAWAFTAFLAVSGIIFLTDRLLINHGHSAWYYLHNWWAKRQEPPYMPPPGAEMGAPSAAAQQPALPAAPPSTSPFQQMKLPLWKKLVGQTQAAAPNEPPPAANMVLPNGPTTPRVEPVAPTSNPAAAPTRTVAEPPAARRTLAEPAIIPARIIGGDQEWRLPRLEDVLGHWDRHVDSDEHIRNQGRLIQETLALFGVPADFEGAYKGPAVTQYLIKPGYVERTVKGETRRTKVKVSKIASLSNDLALALAAPSVRIEAPIPGTSYVGVEVPNQESNFVGLRDMMESETFQNKKGRLRVALGEDVKGNAIVSDMARMPHLLIAGATGSGKSICINSIITCLLCTHTPDTLRFLMVDPKMVELSGYNGIPHLLSPVVTETDKAAGVLYWAVKEMERRYQLCSKANCRDLERYNEYLAKRGEKQLPYIVVIVDEMADLMMAAPEEVEKYICRLAQMARAIGIHLIIATQRPSVDVITGLIKANFPSRIAFAVTSQTDSRVILDVPGAERLLGRGDMLFMAPDASKLERIQGTYLHEDEINKLVRHWKGIRQLNNDAFTQPLFEEPAVGAEGVSPQLPPANPASRPAVGTSASAPSSTRPESRGAPSRPPMTTPSSGGAIEQMRQAPGGSQPRYGAPPEQGALFDEIEQMKAEDARDELFEEAIRTVRENGRGSVSLLQRKLRIGYNRASRLVDQMEEAGILGPDAGGTAGREVLTPKSAPRIIGEGGANSSAGDQDFKFWM
ncbi:MAG: DNA translocase FtsK 4TM domain-containing protein [Caldilineaceae bacterium]